MGAAGTADPASPTGTGPLRRALAVAAVALLVVAAVAVVVAWIVVTSPGAMPEGGPNP